MSPELKADEERFLFEIAGKKLGVVDFTAREEISTPFEVDLTLATEEDINFDDVIGKEALLTILGEEIDRYFHGIINEFMQTGSSGRFLLYQATVVPSIWLLSLEQDCRIFQEKRVDEIVEQIITDAGIPSDRFKFRLQNQYPARNYCVQYRETDLNFISRLLEEEGIYYFFEHTEDKHLLVFGDSTVNYQPIQGKAKLLFHPPDAMVPDEEVVYGLVASRQIQTGKVTLRDFNFEKPSLDLTSEEQAETFQKLEVYDYPGEYSDENRGKKLAGIRLQEAITFKDKVEGESNCLRFVPGFTFKLTDHERESSNQEYLLSELIHSGSQPGTLEERAGGGAFGYSNQFIGIPSSVTLKPERKTPKPIVEGVQTAIVVGPSGEEIYTDEHGRVKVQFHWDREGKKDEKSSCWIRVSQAWAGQRWGSMHIPHVGQEVIVDFIEGDPDRPIITGRVYNANNMSPDPLPDKKTRSIICDNFGNEIVFDATPGDEYIRLHSPHHNSTITLGRSIEFKSVSDERKYTHGNTSTVRVGMAHDCFLGSKFIWGGGAKVTGFLGVNADVFLGGKFSINWGPKFSFDFGGSVNINRSYKYTYCKTREITVNKLDYIRASDKDIVHDSDGKYRAIGGDKDNSIVECAEKSLTLAYGVGKPGVNVKSINAAKMVGAALAGGVASLGVAGAAASGAAMFARDNKAPDDPNDPRGSRELEWPDFWGPTGLGVSLGGFAIAGLTSWKLGRNILKPLEDKKAVHTTVHSKIVLKEEGVSIVAGNTSIEISKDGDIKLFTEKNIEFAKCGEIKFHDWVKLDSGMLKFLKTQKLKMQSLEVTK